MTRSFVAFDDSYRVPVPVNVSRAVACGGTVHVCGPLHMDGAGVAQDPGDLAAQTHAAMRHMRAALAAMDGAFDEVVKVNARFTGDWDERVWGLNVGIRSDYYGKPGPASTGIVVSRLEVAGAMIQAGCVAVSD